MNPETLIRTTLDEWSAEARVPDGLAGRALRRRARRRVQAIGLVAVTTALVAAIALVPSVLGGRPAGPATRPVDTRTFADPAHSPPVRFVAAGKVAMSAYYVVDSLPTSGDHVLRRTWHLYDPATGGYRTTPWAYLAVAPGLRTAAVLEGPLPAARVGLVNTSTRKVVRWIRLDHPAAGLAWSPDGRRLLVTTYSGNPDEEAGPMQSTRTGFAVVTVRSGRVRFHALPPDGDDPNGRQDLGWSRDGTLVWAPTARADTTKRFYDLAGGPHAAPPHEAGPQEDAGLSPDGRLLATTPKDRGYGPVTDVIDVSTGRTAGTQRVEQLRVWADDTHLIAVACDVRHCTGRGEFHNRLVLVSVDGRQVTPLTGYQTSDVVGAWEPVFSPR